MGAHILESWYHTQNSWPVFRNLVFEYSSMWISMLDCKKFPILLVLGRHLLKMAILYGKPAGAHFFCHLDRTQAAEARLFVSGLPLYRYNLAKVGLTPVWIFLNVSKHRSLCLNSGTFAHLCALLILLAPLPWFRFSSNSTFTRLYGNLPQVTPSVRLRAWNAIRISRR